MELLLNLSILLIAYATGSIPTALIYSRTVHHEDIRERGDGNMGARNTKRVYGARAGVVVALIDIFKGALVVWLVRLLQLPLGWQICAAALVILGHDFPAFAGFKGGQGFAVTTGVLLGFFFWQTIVGFVVYAFLFLLFHNSDVAAGFGMGGIVLQQILGDIPLVLIVFSVCALLSIPLKQWLDKPRRVHIQQSSQKLQK